MRVAIVHDWLYTVGGAEKVLKELFALYPDADLFCLFDNLPPADRAWIGYEKSTTTFLQRLVRRGDKHRGLLPLMPLAIEQLDVSNYDLVISSSCAVAKGVLTGPDQVHIAYIHTPMRYAWDLQEEYLGRSTGFGKLKATLARMLLHRIRLWDTSSAARPNCLVANSRFVSRRIAKTWGRSSLVVYPPVDTQRRAANVTRGEHFFTVSRLVPYKNTRVIIEAFKHLPDLRLVVGGTGPEEAALRKIAGPNVTFLGYLEPDALRREMASAQAFVFAALEDFGITPVEAQAEGTPVIALGKGGARETVVSRGPNRTGLFFNEATPSAIAAAVNSFIAQRDDFRPQSCIDNARRFEASRFAREMKNIVDTELTRLRSDRRGDSAISAAAQTASRPTASAVVELRRAENSNG
jgi:glycosyltransferase involved in cell wall biosynthesis